jgi:anti-sigma factor RsiW
MSRRGGPECEPIREKLVLLLDGELPREATGEVRAHIETCPDCGEEWEALLRLRRTAREGELDPTPEEKAAILRASSPLLRELRKGKGRGARPRAIHGALRWAPRLAAAALVLLALLWVTERRTGERELRSADVVTYQELLQKERGTSFPTGAATWERLN